LSIFVALLSLASAGQLPYDLPRTCYAYDSQTLSVCVSRLRNTDSGLDNIDNLKIASAIQCNGSNACRIDLTGLKNTSRTITIYGDSNSTTGFIRSPSTSYYNYAIVDVTSTAKVQLRDFYINDGIGNVNPLPSICPINIAGSTDILVDSISISNSKFCGVALVGANVIALRNTTISNAALFGVWMSNQYPSSDIRIENNTITGSASNGILYASLSGSITGNVLTNNHNTAMFCDPTTGIGYPGVNC